MDFKTAARLGTYLAKDYAQSFFDLLVNYKDVSASEAASRLNLHIQTAQDFLEAMTSLGIVSKVEVFEKKRPYFRYALKQKRIQMEIDLEEIQRDRSEGALARRINEKRNAGAAFATARHDDAIASVAVWAGEGRQRKQRKINLTTPQGKFLFHLPFPNAEPLSIEDIMRKADLDESLAPEIIDIVEVLEGLGVIEAM